MIGGSLDAPCLPRGRSSSSRVEILFPGAKGLVANTDTKLLIYRLFQKARVLAQDGVVALCIVKTAPPTKSRTYAPLEFRAEDGETPPLCSTLLSSSSCAKTQPF